MTIAIMFFVVLIAALGFTFKKWPFLMVAGLGCAGAGLINVTTYAGDTGLFSIPTGAEANMLGWLVGWVLVAASFAFFFGGAQVSLGIQREAYDKEVERIGKLPPVIDEETAYRQELDEIIAEGRRVKGPARRKKVLADTTRRLYGLSEKER